MVGVAYTGVSGFGGFARCPSRFPVVDALRGVHFCVGGGGAWRCTPPPVGVMLH